MVVQFDIDGVLASFTSGFQKLADAMGKDPTDPRVIGTTPDDGDQELWAVIRASETFWLTLPALVISSEFKRIGALAESEIVYFVTNRVGLKVKQQTEQWLSGYGVWHPTVIISASKGEAAKVLGADYAIDDKAGNAVAISYMSRSTRSYLLDRPRNQFDHNVLGNKVIRVKTVGAFLDAVEGKR